MGLTVRTGKRSVLAAVAGIASAAIIAVITGAPEAGAATPPLPSTCPAASSASFDNGVAVAVPDSGGPVASSTINVAGAGTFINDVDLRTNITHTFPGDLDFTLTSPAGTIVTISSDNAATNDNVWNDTRFDDQADPDGVVPYTTNDGLVNDHHYEPGVTARALVPEEPLASLIGEDPNGIWTLTLDDDTSGDTGTLNSWGLDIQTLAAAPGETRTFNAGAFPDEPIPETGGPVVVSTAQVTGAGSNMTGLEVFTDIRHTFPGDLDITLTSPAGTSATITTDNAGTNDDAFRGTLFANDANPGGLVPYTTNNGLVNDHAYAVGVAATPLTPEESFAAFSGENPNGTWTLRINDDTAPDTGRLFIWGLQGTTSCAEPPAASPEPTPEPAPGPTPEPQPQAPPAEPPTLAIGDRTVKEGDDKPTKAKLKVELSRATDSRVEVDFATTKGSAKPKTDFKARSGHLVFAPGETKKVIVVKIVGDSKTEKKERFSVELSKPSNATLGDDTGTVTIRKSD